MTEVKKKSLFSQFLQNFKEILNEFKNISWISINEFFSYIYKFMVVCVIFMIFFYILDNIIIKILSLQFI